MKKPLRKQFKMDEKFWVLLPDTEHPLRIVPMWGIWGNSHKKVKFDLGYYRTRKQAEAVLKKIKKLVVKEMRFL